MIIDDVQVYSPDEQVRHVHLFRSSDTEYQQSKGYPSSEARGTRLPIPVPIAIRAICPRDTRNQSPYARGDKPALEKVVDGQHPEIVQVNSCACGEDVGVDVEYAWTREIRQPKVHRVGAPRSKGPKCQRGLRWNGRTW